MRPEQHTDPGAKNYRRYLNGDDEGMVALIRDYKDGLLLYLNGYAGNLYLAEEWMEEVFVKLATRKPWFRGNCSFRTWLYAIGRNTALDALRKGARAPAVPLEELAEREDEEANLERSYLRQERNLILHHAMKKLKSDYRQALYLSFFEGFDNAEIGRVLKKTRRQVENLLYRGKQALKAELEKEGFLYEDDG